MIHLRKPQLGKKQPKIDVLSYGLKAANILDLSVLKLAKHRGPDQMTIPFNSSTLQWRIPKLLEALTTYNTTSHQYPMLKTSSLDLTTLTLSLGQVYLTILPLNLIGEIL